MDSLPHRGTVSPTSDAAEHSLHMDDVLRGVIPLQLADISPALLAEVVSEIESSEGLGALLSANADAEAPSSSADPFEAEALRLKMSLVELEHETIHAFMQESSRLIPLHQTALSCLETLREDLIAPTEILLRHAQCAVSQLLRLDVRAKEIGRRAANCGAVAKGLAGFLSQVVVSPRLIRGIMLDGRAATGSDNAHGRKRPDNDGVHVEDAEAFGRLLVELDAKAAVLFAGDAISRLVGDVQGPDDEDDHAADDRVPSPVDINAFSGAQEDDRSSASAKSSAVIPPPSLQTLESIVRVLVRRACFRIFTFLRAELSNSFSSADSSSSSPLSSQRHSSIQFRKQSLLQYTIYVLFLRKYHPMAYRALRSSVYATAAASYYSTTLRRYWTELVRKGRPLSSRRTYLAAANVALDPARREAMRYDNALGRRGGGDSESAADSSGSKQERPPLIPQYLEGDETSPHYEEVVRSFLVLLCDVIGAEYAFALQFFRTATPSSHIRRVFGPLQDWLVGRIERYVEGSADVLGVLLILRYVDWYDGVMRRERGMGICVQGLFSRLRGILWPRFKYLFSMHLTSIASIRVVGRDGQILCSPSSVDSSLSGSSIVVLAKDEMTDFGVTRRYAHFLVALHTICRLTEERVLFVNLSTLRRVFLSFLNRVAKTLQPSTAVLSSPSSSSDISTPIKKPSAGSSAAPMVPGAFKAQFEEMAFLINAYELVVRLLLQRGVFDSETGVVLAKLLEGRVQAFVELQLKDYFGDLVGFTLLCETMLAENPEVDMLQLQGAKVASIDVAFRNRWEGEMERMLGEHEQRFHDQQLALDVTKKVLIQLSLYYGRFYNVVRRMFVGQRSSDNADPGAALAVMPLRSEEFGPSHILRFSLDRRGRADRRRRMRRRGDVQN